QGVLSLGGWALRIHTEYPPCYSGSPQGGRSRFVYRAVTSCGGPFHGLRLRAGFVTPRVLRCGLQRVPRPRRSNATALSHCAGLGSSPFARRYLGSRGCFPFLALLRCFTSGGSPQALWIRTWVTGHDPGRVPPFGHPRISAFSAAPRGFSQPDASFIGSWRQGIHREPFVTWQIDARARYPVLKVLGGSHPQG